MSYGWFRHWHGLATDPKLAFVAKKCRRPMCEVVAVFVSMLENASANSDDRGTMRNWDHEVAGCSLDIEPMHVEAIYMAMQGKLLVGNRVAGWLRRQPKREDDSAERVRAHRAKKRTVTQCNAEPAPVTLDKEEDKEEEVNTPLSPQGGEKREVEPTPERKPIKCDPNGVAFDGMTITMDPTNRAFWIEQFEGDERGLDLALLQAAKFVQVNSSRPLVTQVGQQLARTVAEKRDRDRRYAKAVAERQIQPTQQPTKTAYQQRLAASRAVLNRLAAQHEVSS